MAKTYSYSSAPGHIVGRMICSCCGKKITEGDFRYRETDEAYIPQHRACTANDPKWQRIDSERAKRRAHKAGMLSEAIVFRDKWGVSELDDLIEELQSQLSETA